MARIRKHRDKWQVLYRDPVTKTERSAGAFCRESDASKHRRAVEYRLQTGEWIDPELRPTAYCDWAARWLPTKANLKPKTLERYTATRETSLRPRVRSASDE
jgi:hypothetical protein